MTLSHRPKPRFVASLALIASLCFASVASVAQERPKVTKIAPPKSSIFIGNSFFYYNDSLHSMVLNLLKTADPADKASYRSTSVTISGSGFDWHDIGVYFRPDAVGRYSFDDNNNVVFNKLDKLFDIAIMMDCSQCPIHPQLKDIFVAYAKKNAEIVRSHGTEPVYFMSWAYADKPEMTRQLADAYTAAGNANNALVIPAGLAFARAIEKRPTLNLYAPDKRHPSPAGSYLAAATVYAATTGQSPVGNGFAGPVDKDTAAFLQGVAWETVQAYYKGE
ncbi:hypothetical protein [Bradyrhizobium prioriisuperbiae]|uniref:hypothetical protein n=1 Tax=Bradyrhizobium prioriisuperbiae TaxID=2854389 RepID=UPI0028E67DB7|nr:hypothetical protein [Bradyrhizobium prioritasuperba]